MPKLNLERLKGDLRAALTGEIIVRHYLPNENLANAKTGDEYKVKCCLPGHVDDTPSLFISESKFVYHCKGQCGGDVSKGDFIKFIQVMDGLGFMDATKKACDLCGLSISAYEDGVELKALAPKAKKTKAKKEKRPPIDESVVNEMHEALLAADRVLAIFCKRRNLELDDVKKYKIGIDKRGNYALPIYDEDGNIVSIKYRHKDERPPGSIPKYWSYKVACVENPDKTNRSHWHKYGDTKLFGIEHLSDAAPGSTVIITAGEYDAIQINRLNENNLIAISSTSGEGTWSKSWNSLIAKHNVYICFDNDATGRVKAKQLAKDLGANIVGLEAYVGEKGDLTDFFLKGLTVDIILELLGDIEAKPDNEENADKQEVIKSLRSTRVQSVNPAFFIDPGGVVYITSMFEREKDMELKNGSVVTYKTNEPMIISSKRGVYEIPRVSKEIIREDKFAVATFKDWTVKQEPNSAQSRWAGLTVLNFLKGKEPMMDVKEVFKDIYFSIKRYSKFYRKTYRGLVALYVMGSYFYEGFQSYPYIHLHGEKGSGKSTLGRVIAALSFNGDFVISPTVAVIARSIQEKKGLFVFDEVEQQSQRAQGRSEMGQIFNSGYQRGAKRPVCDPDNQNKRVDFDLYCPKVICNIFGLNDTTKNRCISIRMQKITDRSNKIKDPQTDPDLREISLKMYGMMMAKTPHMLAAYEEVKVMDEFAFIGTDEPSLTSHGRERELYIPLFSIAKFIYNESGFAEPWNSLIRELRYISGEKTEDEQDAPEERLRNAIRDILIERSIDRVELNMYDLVVAYKGQYVESPGNAVEHWIGKTLRKLNLSTPPVGGKQKRKTVTVTYTAKDGTRHTDKKKLLVFEITRERLKMNPIGLEDQEIPF